MSTFDNLPKNYGTHTHMDWGTAVTPMGKLPEDIHDPSYDYPDYEEQQKENKFWEENEKGKRK